MYKITKCIIDMFKKICIIDLLWKVFLLSLGDASVYLTVPSAGNCDDDTVLTCTSDEELRFTGWFGLNRSLVINGEVVSPEDSEKYSQTVNGNSFSLTIHNTDISDEGNYGCNVRFTQSTSEALRVECRAKYVNLSVTKDRTLVLAIDKIYPQPQIQLDILDLKKNGTETTASGTFTRRCSTSNWLFDCVWTSNNIFPDGNYSYNATITTITASVYPGYFRISTPNSISFSPSTKTYRVEENRLMNNVTCSADCAPDCEYVWNGRHGNNISNSSVLSLGEVDRSTNVEYTCTAWNWFGEVNMSILLIILYGPENIVFTPPETTYTKTEGAVMERIQCSVTCNPNCSLNWFKSDTLVSSTGDLELRNIQRGDMGHYQCVATNDDIPGNPSVQKSIEINVRYGPDTVRLSSASDIPLTAGELAPNVTCSADCNPPCSFTWTNMTNSSVQAHGNIFSFGIAKHAFQGEYRCTVTNNATGKTIYASVTVTVESAALSKTGTPIGAVVGGAIGAVVLICLVVVATFLLYRHRKQKVNENTKEQRKESSQGQSQQETMDTTYQEPIDRGKRKKEDVYDQLDVSVTVNENTNEQRGGTSQGKSHKETLAITYEKLTDHRERKKDDVYDQLDASVNVNENTKEQREETSQGQSHQETMNTAYEEPIDRGKRKKEDIYDQLDASVTDISVYYENTPKQ